MPHPAALLAALGSRDGSPSTQTARGDNPAPPALFARASGRDFHSLPPTFDGEPEEPKEEEVMDSYRSPLHVLPFYSEFEDSEDEIL